MFRWIVSVALLASSAAWAATPEQKCQGGKNEAAGKLAACLAKAEKKRAGGVALADYNELVSKCTAKFQSKWQKLEASATGAGRACPTTTDQSAIGDFVSANGVTLAAALQAGGALPACGDNAINAAAEQCDGSALGGETCVSLGFDSGTLTCSACQFDTANCILHTFPASGQTTAYGPGSDGVTQAGATMSFTDNGDGTITDNRTGLMWEKKDDSGGIHDVDNGYSFGSTVAPYAMDGTMVTTFLAVLNAGSGFAGHKDWRIPNIKELLSIVDYEVAAPGLMVNAAFHRTATCAGCTNVTLTACSCTSDYVYWSSTTRLASEHVAWGLYFNTSFIEVDLKTTDFRVRAVRGGL